jgi:hypothetical protein
MAQTIQTFDAQSIQRIAGAVRRLESQVQNLQQQLGSRNKDMPPARIIRTGITATNEQFPTYPEPPANTFLVQFEDWTWEEKDWEDEAGDLDQSLYAWPKKFVFARTKNGSYLEKDTRVFLYRVATKSGDRWYILDDELTPFELLVDVYSVDGFPVQAKEITPDGSEGNEITVDTDPLLGNIYGPAATGFRGWARRVDDGTDDEGRPKHKYLIVHMQRFARHILFTAPFYGTCTATPLVSAYWDGEDPYTSPFTPLVDVEWLDCECLQNETGIAVFDEQQSSGGTLFYHAVSLDQTLKMADVDECDEEGYSCLGDSIRTLLVGKGLTLLDGDCSGQTCTKVLQADMLEVVGSDCAGEETSKLGVQTLYVDSPLKMEAGDESECLGTARISLPEDFIGSDCIEVEYTDECKFNLTLPENFITGGDGVVVTPRANGCGYMVSVNGGNADPLVTIQYVCGIECVYNESTEEYELVVSYGTIDLPASLVQNATSECEETPTPPGDGEYITIESLSCDSWPDKYVSVTLNSLPDNTDYYILRTTNERTGEFVEFGPDTDNHEATGTNYWFVIPAASTAGDTIQVEIEFYDAGGAMLDNQVEYAQCPAE